MGLRRARCSLAAWSIALAALPPGAAAHDLISAHSAGQYLESIQRAQEVLRADTAPAARARASVALGRTLDEIRDLLNRDIASHGRPQGLPTLALLRSLGERGLALEVSAALGRYPANLDWYRSALRLDPDGASSGEARLRLLQGHFYDSFDQDPLRPRGQSWAVLQEQIRHAVILSGGALAEPEREEVQFILAVHCLQAQRAAPDPAAAAAYAASAREHIARFRARYPDSLRLAALEALQESRSR